MFRVTMQLGGKPVGRFTFDKAMVTIGRDPTCDIVVDNVGCSRRHAVIEHTQDGYVLADLKSHNGTFVAGERVFHHRLHARDEFLIAKYGFHFQELEEEPEEVTEPVFPDVPDEQTFHLDPADLDRLVHRSARAGRTQIVQLAPDGDRGTVDLDGVPVTIGSLPGADVRLRGLMAPPRAAVLVKGEDGWHALGTTRRFRVNGEAAWDVLLADGDLLTCGRARLRFSQA